MVLVIRNNRVEGARDVTERVPNRGGQLSSPRFLVFHYTGGLEAEGTVESFSDPERKASAHLIIDRDGGIIQCVPFNLVAWHAGQSQWKTSATSGIFTRERLFQSLNRYAIGVEVVNAGWLRKTSNRYLTWAGRAVAPANVMKVDPKLPESFGREYWHIFEDKQIDACVEIAKALWSEFSLVDILGHSDIAPGRKVDPGPAFPLAEIRALVAGRAA